MYFTNSSNFQPSVVEQEHKYAQTQFEKLIKEYEPRLGNGSKLRYIIKKGKVYREVVNQVNSYKNAVVSASTHGASGFEELFIGSNALKIMAATEQPVFTIRAGSLPTSKKLWCLLNWTRTPVKRLPLPPKWLNFSEQNSM